MRKGLCSGAVMLLALFLSTRTLEAQLPLDRAPARACMAFARAAAARLVPALLHWNPGRLFTAFPFRPQAQDSGGSGGGGSGDGGGSTDGGSSDGGSTDGSSSDSSSSTDDSGDAAAAAAAVAAAAAAAQDAPGDPAALSDPTTDPTTVAQNTPESPLDAIQSQATTDPRGGAMPSSFDTPGGGLGAGPAALAVAAGPVPPDAGGAAPRAGPVDITINAVIVSGASSPWHAVQRAPGVRNVIVNGGIIAWGKTPLPGEPPPGPQPDWLYVNPDPGLVDGSAIPPVVPNIIDIRWLNCPIKVIEKPDM